MTTLPLQLRQNTGPTAIRGSSYSAPLTLRFLYSFNAKDADVIFADLQNPKDNTVLLNQIGKYLGKSAKKRCFILVDQFEQVITELE
ncbi:hypothetical protein [Methyloglobulus sp.]|uniref:hypothetical protein n=1 Tax=Methyloglobulus sp. TaxID=2518622 RepID=UPI0032B707CF